MRVALTIISITLLSSICLSATIYVPDNYSTIQEAINASVAGDTVQVGAVGTHMHVEITRRVEHCHGEVAVLDVVSTTGICVATNAVLARRYAAVVGNTARDNIEVNFRVG